MSAHLKLSDRIVSIGPDGPLALLVLPSVDVSEIDDTALSRCGVSGCMECFPLALVHTQDGLHFVSLTELRRYPEKRHA